MGSFAILNQFNASLLHKNINFLKKPTYWPQTFEELCIYEKRGTLKGIFWAQNVVNHYLLTFMLFQIVWYKNVSAFFAHTMKISGVNIGRHGLSLCEKNF